jgi:hypothetical protein
MDPDPETAEAMHQQQGRYAAQMQTNPAHLEDDDIRFEIPEWLYTEARDLYESRNGSISPEILTPRILWIALSAEGCLLLLRSSNQPNRVMTSSVTRPTT